MFDTLSSKLESFIKHIKGHGKFTEKNVEEISQKLRMTLLEADVHFKVAKDLVSSLTQKALGQKIHESLTPAQQYIKLLHEELVIALGNVEAQISFKPDPPLIILMVGLQGSGKTTTCGKLAKYLRDEKKRFPYLIPADVYRPAAIEQLKIVSEHINISCFDSLPSQKPLEICMAGLKEAKLRGLDTIIIDTAGRLHIDDTLMEELNQIKQAISPHEILLVADAMTGQEALRIAKDFHEKIGIMGIILSKMDSDARGGAALSMKTVTGQPIKFVGTGEKYDAFEVFYPDRMASRILQMGDMLTLIEKTQKTFDEVKTQKMEEKIKRGDFTLEDFKENLKQMQNLGSFQDIMGMIPGFQRIKGSLEGIKPEKEFKKIAAIIDSMTKKERRDIHLLNGSRRLRIAKGSGTEVSDINKLVNQFLQIKKMMKNLPKFGMRNSFDLLKGMWPKR